MAVGRSTDRDSYRAGAAAAAGALAHDDARLVLVFASVGHDPAELVRGVTDVTGRVPLIGASTSGEIAVEGPADRSVVVTVLGGPGFTVSVTASIDLASRQRAAGAEVAAGVEAVRGSEHQVLLLLADGMVGQQQEVIRGVYGVLGASVPIVGGCSGDDLRMESTWLLHDDRVLSNAVLGAAIGSDAPFGIGVDHGWRKVGDGLAVTESADGRVRRLDDEPALDVYLGRLGAPEAAYTDQDEFTRFALRHPLALRRRGGEEMRFIAGADLATRELLCVADVPAGAMVWLTEGDDQSVLSATDVACRSALDMLGDRPPIGLLAFDCVARRGVLGDEGIRQEIARIERQGDGAAVAGFYTYGEYARVRGSTGFHNQTLVVLAVS
jgi:hypothetical protein